MNKEYHSTFDVYNQIRTYNPLSPMSKKINNKCYQKIELENKIYISGKYSP